MAGIVAQAAIKILSFTFTVLVIRRLGVATYGQYAAVLAFGTLFVTFADLGLSPFTVRAVARHRDQEGGEQEIERLYANVITLRLMLAALSSAMVMVAGWLTGRPFEMMIGLGLGVVGLMIYALQGASEAVLAGYERLDWSAAARVLQQLLFVILGAIVLFLALGYHYLILANLAGISLLTVICWFGVRRLGVRAGKIEPKTWAPLLKAALPFGIIGLTLGLSYKFDSVLLNIYKGDEPTGIYNSAYTLIFAVVMLSNVVNTALYPSLARQSVKSPQMMPVIYERVIGYLLIISLPVAVGGWLLSDRIAELLYGAEYAAAGLPLSILIWVIPMMFLTEFLGYVIVIDGAERRVAGAIAISSVLNVSLNLLLVPRFGVIAAAFMTVVTEAVLLSQYLWLLRSLLTGMNWSHILLRPIAAATVMGVVVYAARDLPVLLVIAIGAVAYVSMLLVTGAVGRSEINFLRTLRQPAA
jgi:O-antigen/teichoic acid export membrane protein